MATRRTAERAQFDHGAQYFTVRDERFERYVKFLAAGWNCRTLGSPHLHFDLRSIRMETEEHASVGRCPRHECHMPTSGERPRHSFRSTRCSARKRSRPLASSRCRRRNTSVCSTASSLRCRHRSPPNCSRDHPLCTRQLARSVWNGCWAALLVFDQSFALPFNGAFVHESSLSWIARNNSKPQRGSQESWVLHASPEWSNTCLEDEPDQVLPKLLDAFWQATDGDALRPHQCRLSPLALRLTSGASAVPVASLTRGFVSAHVVIGAAVPVWRVPSSAEWPSPDACLLKLNRAVSPCRRLRSVPILFYRASGFF